MAQLKRDMDAFKKKAKAEQERAARMVGLATDSVSREINFIAINNQVIVSSLGLVVHVYQEPLRFRFC